jgi:hypothetical protein
MRNIIILGLVCLTLTSCGGTGYPTCSDTITTNCAYSGNDFTYGTKRSTDMELPQYYPTTQPVQVTPQTTRRTNTNYMINTPSGYKSGSCVRLQNGYIYCP